MNDISCIILDGDRELKDEQQSFYPLLEYTRSRYSMSVSESGKKKCKICCNSIYMKNCEHRCKSIIPVTVVACLTFSYLISLVIVYFVHRCKCKKDKV